MRAAVSSQGRQVAMEDGEAGEVERETPKSVTVGGTAVRPPLVAIPKLAAVLPKGESLRPQVQRMPGPKEFTYPEPIPSSALPPRQSVQPQPEIRQADFPRPAELSQPAKACEPQPVAASQRGPEKPLHEPQTAPAQSWEHVSSRPDWGSLTDVHHEEIHEPEQGGTQYDPATRMSGLRKLIFSLVLKNQNRPAEALQQLDEAPTQVEPMLERRHNSIAQTPPRKEAPRNSASLVSAPPESLPPKSTADKTDKGRPRTNSAAGRRDRRDAFDNVDILPSWRGQYKKR